jgi:hypothetical protein
MSDENGHFMASNEEMEVRQQLADEVKRARRLTPTEAETVIRFAKDEDTYLINASEKTLVKSILGHSMACMTRLTVQDENETFSSYRDPEEVLPLEDSERVVSISARMPIGTLTVKGSSRNSDSHAQIINTPSDVADIREAFDNGED